MNHDDRNKKGGARRSRALVLGAGGPVGRTWQSGLIAGLIEREIDLGDASLIIGTSAGAIVGAQLALGLKFAAPSKFDLAGVREFERRVRVARRDGAGDAVARTRN